MEPNYKLTVNDFDGLLRNSFQCELEKNNFSDVTLISGDEKFIKVKIKRNSWVGTKYGRVHEKRNTRTGTSIYYTTCLNPQSSSPTRAKKL